MADAIGLTEAAQTLKDHFGERLNATYNDGRQQMIDALRERLHVSAQEAKRLVDALETAHTIRWIEGGQTDVAPSTGLFSSASQAPVGSALPMSGGYWQL